MFKNSDFFIKNTLGEDFIESLIKTEIYKPGTRTVIDTSDIHLGLKLVPRVIMSLLIHELVPMAIGETKEVQIPVPKQTIMRVTKMERDSLNGEIIQENKKIAEFLHRSIPGIGLILMSTLELYEIENISKPSEFDHEEKIQKLIDEKLRLHDLINGVVDRKLAERDAVNQILLSKLTEALEQEKDKHEQTRVQLAGCSVAAFGGATGQNDAKPGDYGHSASFDDVKRLREETDKIKSDIDNVNKIQKDCLDGSEYMRGMANGLEVANSIANKKEPNFVESPKKGSPLKGFLEKKEQKKSKKNEYKIQMIKGEHKHCPDCGKDIFSEDGYSGCICMGENQNSKIYLKKTEDGVKIRFSKDWDIENIQMLLEVLRGNNG